MKPDRFEQIDHIFQCALQCDAFEREAFLNRACGGDPELRSRVFLQQPGDAKVGLFATSETEFFLRVVDAAITFKKDASGRVSGLVLHQKGDHVGKRIK